MESELDVIESLEALAYKGKCLQNDVLTRALEGGVKSEEFREVICWLTHELQVLRKTDEQVSAECDDPSEFAMELSAMLKELGCPFTAFVAGPLSERFESREARIQLLEYLITELMATKMSMRLRPKEDGGLVIKKTETNTARALEQLSRELGLGKPPDNIAPKALFDKLNFKLEEQIRAAKPGLLSEPLLRTTNPLTDAQWDKLDAMHSVLNAEYDLRRQMLLTRLEVTIQSFQWSDKMRSRENEIIGRFQKKLQELELLMHGGENTNLVALLAARADLAIIEHISSANVRKNTASKIQKHVIGSVPDRGGRADEHAPPPPEMPSWQQQRASGPAGGGGGGGGFRGGRGSGGGGQGQGRGGGGGGQGRGGGGYGGGQGRGGGGRGGGGGGGGGGNWQNYSNQQQPQRPQFEQNRDQNWIQGSGRVQGSGWGQGGGGDRNNYDRGGNYQQQQQQQQYQQQQYQQQQFNNGGGRNSGGGGGNFHRGHSNYNRGGRGGGGGGGYQRR